jgi:UDP-glucose 4-epimerase
MHVFITGGAGFIGSHLVEYHLNKGDKVYVLDNLSTGCMDNITPYIPNPNFQYEIADILTWTHLTETVTWADRIYHLAAVVGVFRVLEDPVNVLATNIAGCERLLRAVASSKWHPEVLIASSSEVYGSSPKQPLSENDALIIKSAAHSRWSYTISKLADESFSLAYARKIAAKITIVRLFNTIGPRQTGRYGMVVPRFIQQAVKGEPITIYGDGTQTRSFCDVRDTVTKLDLLVSNEQSINDVINLGNDNEISINDLALLTKKLTQSNSPIQHLSYEEAYGEPIDETMRRKPCLKKLNTLIDYKNKWSLDDTILDLAQRITLER